MPDEQLPDGENLSKRERQKLRRQRRLEAQRAEQRRARRRRTVATAVIALVLLGGTGAFAAQWALDRADERRQIAAAQENLASLGCTTVEDQPILGREHFSGPELAENPPDVIYPDRPATSGTHIGQWAITGVYDKVVDERLLVHNLEHGYVTAYYDQDAPAEEVEALKEFAREQIDSDRYEKLIVAAWDGELPGDANFALAAWGVRQLCEQFDEGVGLGFLREHHYLAGDAPEKELSPHGPGSGVDPDEVDGDLLYPPLDEAPDTDAGTMPEATGTEATAPDATEPEATGTGDG